VVSRDGTAFVLKLKNFQEVERVLAKLREAQVEIVELELQPADLEDVFLRVTGRGQ
jgi:ABC-2 type transport system ATP-binding protein